MGEVKAEVRDLPREHDIIRVGDRGTHSVVVLGGLLQRYSSTADGQRQIHSFYLPSDAPSLETLYSDYMDNNLGAVVDSRIGLIPNAELYRLIDERPEIRKLLWRESLVQAAVFREWLKRNSRMLAHASMAHLFCEIFTRARAAGLVNGDTCDLPLSQQALADALGLSYVHANRTLMLLRDAGMVELRDGKLTVKQWKRLSETAEFDPLYLHLRR